MNTFHLIRLHGRIDDAMYESLRSFIEKIPNTHAACLHINSIGGELSAAHKMSRLIMKHRKRIEIIGIGYQAVHSSALHVFISCTYRMGYSNTQYLLHPSRSDGSKQGNKNYKAAFDYEAGYYSDMLGQPLSLIKTIMEQETYATADQAEFLQITNYPAKIARV